MKISPIDNKQNFNGRVIVLGKISAAQNYLFNLHRKNLEKMISDMPFDLFVKQSRSKNTIMIATDKAIKYKNSTPHYMVRKNEQNFEEAAGYAIKAKEAAIKEDSQMLYEYVKSKQQKQLFNLFI